MMKPSTADKVEGKFHEVKGKVKEKAGQVTNNSRSGGEIPRKIALPASSPTVLNGNIGHSGQISVMARKGASNEETYFSFSNAYVLRIGVRR
jgi:hypothetical protein